MELADILPFCRFETSRSSGPGGQHVNKTNSKVMVFFNIQESLLTTLQKARVMEQLANRINVQGELFVQVSTSRSQHVNKEMALLKIQDWINQALVPPTKRYRTKPTKSSIEKRLVSKKKLAEKKRTRRMKD